MTSIPAFAKDWLRYANIQNLTTYARLAAAPGCQQGPNWLDLSINSG